MPLSMHHPAEGRAASTATIGPTLRSNSFQIKQTVPVTLIECGMRCGVGLVGDLKIESSQVLTD